MQKNRSCLLDKKIFIKCYFSKNLGDDLFLKILCERYNENFVLLTDSNHDIKLKNLKIIKLNFFQKIIRKIYHLLDKDYIFLYNIVKKYKYFVNIGGSIFIENYFREFKLFNLLQKHNIKYYIIGANIGPYKSKQFLTKLKKDVFTSASDVCLRDKESYNLTKNLKNVRYAPDIIFSYDFNKYIMNDKIEKKVLISVIDCYKKKEQIANIEPEKYDKLIIDLIYFFLDKKYKIELVSFCKSEGDEEAINRIYSKLNNKKNVYTNFYDGNIDRILSTIATSSIIVGSRFHANIIGFSMNKVVIPISYNLKTKNMLNDLNFKGTFFDLDNLQDEINFNEIDLNYKVDISLIKENANNHFNELDKILDKRR